MINISEVIPVYNPGNLIKRCLDSILAQKGCYTYEMLMVDDGSTGNVLLQLTQNTAFADAALACKNLDDVFIDEWDDTFSIRFPLYKFYHDAIFI